MAALEGEKEAGLKNDTEENQKSVSSDDEEVSEEGKVIFDDTMPLESNWHRIQINLLIDLVHFLWRDREDYFVGGNMFLYYCLKQVKTLEYRGPDVFIVKKVDNKASRESWIVWMEGGRYPDVIIELSSPATAKKDLGMKKKLYEETFRTQEYFYYNPYTDELLGYRRERTTYEQIEPNEQGWLYSYQLKVWLGRWKGTMKREDAVWIRFYTDDKELLPTPEEFEVQQTQKVRAENERLRSLLAKHGVVDNGTD